MKDITEAYKGGQSLESISEEYGITTGSILKKIEKVKREEKLRALPKDKSSNSTDPRYSKAVPKKRIWDDVNIRSGIEQFILENDRTPTAGDFDEIVYLPSARQVQRSYGGIIKLREKLGYLDTDFTKGELRKSIAIKSNVRGLAAEDYFEKILIDLFGEPYVHVQKRYYKNSKNRYDFFVYAKNRVIAIDIFTTDRPSYIEKNIRHKISRYKDLPNEVNVYFVLVGDEYSSEDVWHAANSISTLKEYPNLLAVHESDFIELISTFKKLELPKDLLTLDEIL